MFYETHDNRHGLRHDPFKALAVPRPIGWVSTVSRDGICNLAPYSFFNAVGERPHYVLFSSAGHSWARTTTASASFFQAAGMARARVAS